MLATQSSGFLDRLYPEGKLTEVCNWSILKHVQADAEMVH